MRYFLYERNAIVPSRSVDTITHWPCHGTHIGGFGTERFSEVERHIVQRSKLFANGVGPIPDGWQDREIAYPHRTLKESDFLAVAEGHGFSCISRLEENSGALSGCYGRQLVFWRC
jgi:hypothetical protein